MDSRPAGPAGPTLPRLRLAHQTPHTDPRPAGPVPTPSPRSSHAHAQSTSNTTNPRLGSMYRAVILVAGFVGAVGGAMVDAWRSAWMGQDVVGQDCLHRFKLLTRSTPPPPTSTERQHHQLRTAARDETRVPSAHACTPDAAASEREHATPQRHGVHACALSFVPLPASPRQRQRQHRVPLPAPALNAHLPVVACTSPRRD
ncbi:hypothetical protein B0H13DRAFT_2495129 [Mycena leptocephala]|nr:hypothetical protein B0H13DRAFT_2495129 [Mycena leptocephala]